MQLSEAAPCGESTPSQKVHEEGYGKPPWQTILGYSVDMTGTYTR